MATKHDQAMTKGRYINRQHLHEVVHAKLDRHEGRREVRAEKGWRHWLYRSMRGSFRGWGSEIENRKISRGTTGKSWTNTWRVKLSPERMGGSSVPWEGWKLSVPCLTGHIGILTLPPREKSSFFSLYMWDTGTKQTVKFITTPH